MTARLDFDLDEQQSFRTRVFGYASSVRVDPDTT